LANIAGIYDLQQSGAERFLVLKLVEGDTIAGIIHRRGALPLDEAFAIGKQICEALEAAHEKGIVHRDLKPANVKVMANGKVKVLDFGLAKAFTAEGPCVILGTVAYMSLFFP
jgi:serine/threonine-protein kinase